MLILITYDVNTETAAGRARLRKVAKQCVNYGTRVQNSVFECILDNAQLIKLKAILTDIIDEQTDSLRFYNLGNKHTTKVNHVGMNKGINVFWCEPEANMDLRGDSHRKICTMRTDLRVCRDGWP